MGVWYCTREDVKLALDVKLTARADAQIDRQIEAVSRWIEDDLTQRRFYPEVATRYFDWPHRLRRTSPWRLYLGRDELISVTSVTSGGTTIAASDYFLEPANSGPPYTRVEIDLASSATFSRANTHQRAVAISGVFGYRADEAAAGTLTEALDASETAVDVSDSFAVGVGSVIRVDTERMLVTGKSMLDTAQNLQTPLTASASSVTVAVENGATFNVGEVILLDSERMLVVDVAGNNLTVKRAWDGTVLAAHTGSDVYAPRTLTVTRGALGTTAATHLTAAAVQVHVVPHLVRELCVAETLNLLLQTSSGYARTVGAGENEREASGRGLAALRKQVRAAYGRKARSWAV